MIHAKWPTLPVIQKNPRWLFSGKKKNSKFYPNGRKNSGHWTPWKVLAVSQDSFPDKQLLSCDEHRFLGNSGFPKCVQLIFLWQNHSAFSAAPSGVWGRSEWGLCHSWWDSQFFLPSLSPVFHGFRAVLYLKCLEKAVSNNKSLLWALHGHEASLKLQVWVCNRTVYGWKNKKNSLQKTDKEEGEK